MNKIRNNKSEQERAPVYIPFKTFLTAVETLEQALPATLDRSVWPSFAGGLQSQTLGAFKFMGLIDEEGKVQPILTRLVNARGDARKEVLGEVIKNRYEEAIRLGERNASFQQLQDFFRKYKVQGGTLERIIRFFLDVCEYTGIKCSPHWAKARKTIKRARRDETTRSVQPTGRAYHENIRPNIKTVELRSGGKLSLSLSVDLLTLSPEDREWLFEIIDRLNKYGETKDAHK